MQQAIPYTNTLPSLSRADSCDLSPQSNGATVDPASNVTTMVSENAVIIIGRRGCCMCHVVKRLLQSLGVNPSVHELHDDQEAAAVVRELSAMANVAGSYGDDGGAVQFPAVFVGGKLFGGLEKVMATHISGELVPILKDAGALWL